MTTAWFSVTVQVRKVNFLIIIIQHNFRKAWLDLESNWKRKITPNLCISRICLSPCIQSRYCALFIQGGGPFPPQMVPGGGAAVMLTPHLLSIHPPRRPFQEEERHMTAEFELQSLSCLAQLLLQFCAREPTCVQRPDISLCPPCPKFYICPFSAMSVTGRLNAPPSIRNHAWPRSKPRPPIDSDQW